MPQSCCCRNYYPGHARVLALLANCVPMCYWKCMQRRFKAAMKRPKMPDDQCILRTTPVRWIQDSLREKCTTIFLNSSCTMLFLTAHGHYSERMWLVLRNATPMLWRWPLPTTIATLRIEKIKSTVLSLPTFLGLMSLMPL